MTALVFAATYTRRLTSAQQLLQAQIEQPAGSDYAPVVYGAPVLSPDAQQLAFVVFKDKKTAIFVQRLSAGKASLLSGTEDGSFPFWSPDGRYLGFFANGKLRKIEAAGGPVQALCDAPEGRGGAWNAQGIILFAPHINGPLQRVSDGGGTPEQATPDHKDDKDFTNRNPYFLPDGKHFLFVQRAVYTGSLDGGVPTQILSVGSNVAFSNGSLFYLKDGTLMAQPFDAVGQRFTGKPTPIAQSIEYYDPRNLGSFSVSQNVLLYRQASRENRELVWLDPAGKELEHWGDPAPYDGASFSPSSQTAVLFRDDPDGHGDSLWLADTERKTITRLTPDSAADQRGVVSADGRTVLTSATTGFNSVLVQRSLVASGKEEKLAEIGDWMGVVSQSRDGRYAIVSIQDPKTSFDLYAIDLAGDRKLVPVANSPYSESDGKISPHDDWLAFTSDENGTQELYVTPFPGGGSKWQVSNGSVAFTADNRTTETDWSPDGKSLRYIQGDKLYSVDFRVTGGNPEFSAPKELMTVPQDIDILSIMPDGKRTLATRIVGHHGESPMNLVLNWQHVVQ